ncbi:hypothetical protein ABZ570_34025, partial [Micromonospora sp. NPDC007271]
FRPEFLNRIDDTIVFHQLNEAETLQIVDLMVDRVRRQMREQGMSLRLTGRARRLLAARGFDPQLGARPLRRTIQREIEDALSEQILFGAVSPGQEVVVDVAVAGEGRMGAEFVFHGMDPVDPAPEPDLVDVRRSGADTGKDPDDGE